MHLDRILGKIITTEGRVQYDQIDAQELEATLQEIANATTRGMSRDDRYAFLLNAYNAWAVALAHRHLDARGMRRPWRWLRFFLAPIRVAGHRTNLLLLEFVKLKPLLRGDPRGHFALVCASTGCPPLRNGQYHGDALDDELEASGQAFLQPGVGYLINRQRGVVWTTRILKWYRGDFRAMGGIRKVLERYATEEDAEWMRAERPRIRFQRYDWRRNDA